MPNISELQPSTRQMKERAEVLLQALIANGWTQDMIQAEADRASIWKDGRTPLAFDEFSVALNGTPLTPRQHQAFAEAKLLYADDVVARDRQIQEMVLLWGKGCLAGETHLTDLATGTTRTMEEWAAGGNRLTLWTVCDYRVVKVCTSAVYIKGTAPLYRVILSDGRTFRATGEHRCRTPLGWYCIHDLMAWSLTADVKIVTIIHENPTVFPYSPQSNAMGVAQYTTGLEYATIKAIKPDGEGYFYDLNVPGTHCYFDDQGILHHNSGKDWLSARFISYVAYLILHLQGDPARFFGLDWGTHLDILNIAPSRELARQVFFEYLRANIESPPFIPYLKDHYEQILAEEIRFPQANLHLYSKHSSSKGLDGYNLLAWVMDEADAFLDNAEKSNADLLHRILRTSAITRLRNRWTGIVISYPRVEEGFMLRLHERANAETGFYADKAATWEVRPEIDRNSEEILSEYRADARLARAMFECEAMSSESAFFDFPEKIAQCVTAPSITNPPAAYVIEKVVVRGEHEYVGGEVVSTVPVPGRTYFLGVDGGVSGDAFAYALVHIDETPGAVLWMCPKCGAQEDMRSYARYVRQEYAVTTSEVVICGICAVTPLLFHAALGTMYWWKRESPEQEPLIVGGNVFPIPQIVEDGVWAFKPHRKEVHADAKDRPIDFVSMQEIARILITGLNMARAGFDPMQTVQMIQTLQASTSCEIVEMKFSNPEQYRRARLVRALTYANRLTLVPDPVRDREWRRLRDIKGMKIDHPSGAGESKDRFDAESVAVWLAATWKCAALDMSWR